MLLVIVCKKCRFFANYNFEKVLIYDTLHLDKDNELRNGDTRN